MAYFCGRFIMAVLQWLFEKFKEFIMSLISMIKTILKNIWTWIQRKWKAFCERTKEKFKALIRKHCPGLEEWYEHQEQKYKRWRDARKVEVAKLKEQEKDSAQVSEISGEVNEDEEEMTPGRKLLMMQQKDELNNNENAKRMASIVKK